MLNTLYTITWAVLTVVTIVHLLIHKRNPYSTLAWLFFVLFVPIAGPLIFFFFGPERLERRAAKRKAEIAVLSNPSFSLTEANCAPPKELSDEDIQILNLGKQVSDYPITLSNEPRLMTDPQTALCEMREAIENAKSFIHMQYYIFSADEVTKQLFESLAAAAERGVEVRILYDAFGSLFLKRIHFRKLIDKGVKIAGFLPFSSLPHRLHLNFRNHRKILIIDGKTAFTGGTNIGKEYLGARYANQWRDYTVKVEGPVCLQLEDVFAKDWHFTTQEELFEKKYYPEPINAGNTLIQVLESGPDSEFHSLHQALFLAINCARDEILLTTPYFIPDSSMFSALSVAALRGIKVRILLPAKNDALVVRFASHSFYEDLLKVGVEIYEYEPRILHAKLLTIDGKWTVLGSANMDIRSFKLNFELNLMIYGKEMARQSQDLFESELKQSTAIDLEKFKNRSLGKQMLENLCRLFSPIL